MNENILIIDDEIEIRNLIEIYLKGENYNIFQAENGKQGLNILRNEDIDLIILDLMMPEMNGRDFCIETRKKYDTPIIMLTAKDQDVDIILGLNLGADDYITKPFNPLELIARIKSQLRRSYFNKSKNNNDKNEFIHKGIYLNTNTREIKINDKDINLTPTEFEILKLLLVNKGNVMSMDKIYEEVWGNDFMDSKNTVMVHIRKLREKIELDSKTPYYIKTIWGVGYKIEK
ncbi:MAG: response regulator transcription factor [Thermotogota bacterium]